MLAARHRMSALVHVCALLTPYLLTHALPATEEPGRPLPAAAAGSHCLGEYVADEAGECVLAANGGDADEPTATHRSCAAHQFMCPDRSTCVDTAAAYALCATGRAQGSELHLAASAAARRRPRLLVLRFRQFPLR